jgi:hypothetical protein
VAAWRRVHARRGAGDHLGRRDHDPEDRRTLYAIMFLGAMRFGEAAALTWADYDAACSPLGKLAVEKSYDTKTGEVKGDEDGEPARDAGPCNAGPRPGRMEAGRLRAADRAAAHAGRSQSPRAAASTAP